MKFPLSILMSFREPRPLFVPYLTAHHVSSYRAAINHYAL